MAETEVTAFGSTIPALLQTGQGTSEGETEPVLEEEELFMALTQAERDAWRQMMEQQETTLKNSKDKFSKWYDGITRRRMFAYSRMRKLQEGFRKRGNFYGEIADLVAAMDAKLKAVDSRVKVEQNGNIVDGESTANDTLSQNHEQTPEQNQEQKPQQQQQQHHRQQQEQRQVSQETVVREQTVTVKPLLTQTS